MNRSKFKAACWGALLASAILYGAGCSTTKTASEPQRVSITTAEVASNDKALGQRPCFPRFEL